MKTKVGIVGATGYTGQELIRLVLQHPEVELCKVTSRAESGKPIADLFPNFRGKTDIAFSEPDLQQLAGCDFVFFATPNAVAMKQVPDLLSEGVRVVDLSADFRLKNARTWAHWYGETHVCPELLEEAVYGLPEVHRNAIRDARLVANPGCYPTAVQLAFKPLLEAGVVDSSRLIADVKSGVSGAGRAAKIPNLYSEVSENFRPYGVQGHRHHPEICQGLEGFTGGSVNLTFVPHLLPMTRGIEATLYCERASDRSLSAEALQSLYLDAYHSEPFVDVMPPGSIPETRSVRGTNLCRIALVQPADQSRIVVMAVIDNLVKGAAGQAVQNMNLMLGLPEETGLSLCASLP